MNVHKISNITINRLTSIAKKILWNATSQSNKKSPINWKTLTYHKSRGGLGIRNLITLNKAYIMKNTWRLIHDKNSLWAKVMKGKYFPKTIFITLLNQNLIIVVFGKTSTSSPVFSKTLPSGHLEMVNL